MENGPKLKIKEMLDFLKQPHYLVLTIAIALVVLFMSILVGKTEVEEYIEQNLTEHIDIKSNGNGNVYLRDGIIVSFENVYAENNYIALQVKTINNTQQKVKVTAEIEDLNQKIFYETDSYYYEYLIIGDYQGSTYDVRIQIEQGDRILAEGDVEVSHTMENSTILTSNDVIYFTNEMEVYYLGMDDESLFMVFDNKRPVDTKITFSNDEGGFYLSVPKNTKNYMYITGLGSVAMGTNVYDITLEDVRIEDIEIEKVDDTE